MTPTIPHRDGTRTEHGFVSMVPAQDGGVRAFWLDGRKYARDKAAAGGNGGGLPPGETSLRTAWIGPDGALSDEAEVDDRVCDCCPTSAVGRGGGTVIAYRDRTAGEIRDISLAWLDGHRWSEPAPVSDDGWKAPGCPVNGPAMDAVGERLAVAWFTMAGDSAQVRIAFSSDRGRSFRRPIRVDEGDPLGRMSLILLDDGSALVGWLESMGGGARFEVRRVTADGVCGEPITVARVAATRGAGLPRMVRARDAIYFAWTATGDTNQVQVAEARVP
jgi:hypothetical protein